MQRLVVVLVFAGAAVVAMGLAMFRPTYPKTPTPLNLGDPQEKRDREQFAQDRESNPLVPLPFDGEQALTYVRDLCKIGPRISGTDGMKKQQELIQKHFIERGGKVTFQRFAAHQESHRQPVEMANMIISWFPDRPRRVILCSHYDTRPIADQEEDHNKWHQPFLSANDGGSGVALLMELANHMKELKANVGVDFVLFDGEEYIFDPLKDKYFFGSEHFAQNYRKNRGAERYLDAILLDMVAGKGARFPVEQNSWDKAQTLVQELWGIARELKCTAFQDRLGPQVLDDHLALNRAGIPTVDLIDFDYPHWHRLSDVPENCSAASFEQVARVLTVWLQRVK
jgi:hypothetical protein